MEYSILAQKIFRRFHVLLVCSVLVLVSSLGILIGPRKVIVLFLAIISTIYFVDLLFNFRLIVSSLKKPTAFGATPKELNSEREWPTYTVFCPLYKEAIILPQFIKAMKALQYPVDKLTVMLLLEEDDAETVNLANSLNLPDNFLITVVPHSLPKTKPKACNYGLMLSKSEYSVIFDAEDIPEPDQLKKAVIAFEKAPSSIACLQAKLNFYNPSQNLLTRLFTQEYSLWFNLILVGLQNLKGPVPLGGTSNHFKSNILIGLKGWDPYNVTEDCDLGIRLYKQGFYTAMLDSYTLEEANSKFGNWLRQRSRWVKGYMQTYLVHTGRGRSVKRRKFDVHVLTFHLVVGGKIFTLFVNPLMVALTITYFAARGAVGNTIQSVFPTPVLYIALITLVIGNFLQIYYYIIACVARREWSLIRYVILTPFYWLMMSLAGTYSVYQLIFKPHYWEKTVHGFHLVRSSK